MQPSHECGQRHLCPCRQLPSESQNLQGHALEAVDVEDLPLVDGVCMTLTVGFEGVFGSTAVALEVEWTATSASAKRRS